MKNLSFLILIILIILLLFGCISKNNIDEFKQNANICIDKDALELIELFNLCKESEIYSINQFENKNLSQKGEIFEYNDSKYFIVPFTKLKDASNAQDQILEIFDYLSIKYNIDYVYNFSNPEYMQIEFEESYVDVDLSIQYYPPDVEPEKAVDEYEYYEELKDGFYMYVWYPGF